LTTSWSVSLFEGLKKGCFPYRPSIGLACEPQSIAPSVSQVTPQPGSKELASFFAPSDNFPFEFPPIRQPPSVRPQSLPLYKVLLLLPFRISDLIARPDRPSFFFLVWGPSICPTGCSDVSSRLYLCPCARSMTILSSFFLAFFFCFSPPYPLKAPVSLIRSMASRIQAVTNPHPFNVPLLFPCITHLAEFFPVLVRRKSRSFQPDFFSSVYHSTFLPPRLNPFSGLFTARLGHPLYESFKRCSTVVPNRFPFLSSTASGPRLAVLRLKPPSFFF